MELLCGFGLLDNHSLENPRRKLFNLSTEGRKFFWNFIRLLSVQPIAEKISKKMAEFD